MTVLRPARLLILSALVTGSWTLEPRAAQDIADPLTVVAQVAERLAD